MESLLTTYSVQNKAILQTKTQNKHFFQLKKDLGSLLLILSW